MQEIFEGDKRLFKGLYIYDKWDWNKKYPVIKISFSGDLRTPNKLKNRIKWYYNTTSREIRDRV